jgi:hypothetical protein
MQTKLIGLSFSVVIGINVFNKSQVILRFITLPLATAFLSLLHHPAFDVSIVMDHITFVNVTNLAIKFESTRIEEIILMVNLAPNNQLAFVVVDLSLDQQSGAFPKRERVASVLSTGSLSLLIRPQRDGTQTPLQTVEAYLSQQMSFLRPHLLLCKFIPFLQHQSCLLQI